MRLLIDLNRCQAYAQCCFLAPDVFELRGREVVLHKPETDDALVHDVRRAAAACPVQAIMFDLDREATKGGER